MNFTTDEIWNEVGQLHMENTKLKLQVAQYEAYIKSQQAPQVPAVATATAEPAPAAEVSQN